MSSHSSKEIELDWRVAAATRLAIDLPPGYQGGATASAGSRLLLSCVGDGGSFGKIGFVAPSPVAMAMNLSILAAAEGDALKPAIQFKNSPSPDGSVRTVSIESSTALYDYF